MKASRNHLKKEDGKFNWSRDSDKDGDNLKKSKGKRCSLGFRAYIEHKAENITDGTHIVLQFDVNVAVGSHPVNRQINSQTRTQMKMQIEEIAHIRVNQRRHVSPGYLYHLASIKSEYLRGVDAYLHEGLKKTFKVTLKPIVLILVNIVKYPSWALKREMLKRHSSLESFESVSRMQKVASLEIKSSPKFQVYRRFSVGRIKGN